MKKQNPLEVVSVEYIKGLDKPYRTTLRCSYSIMTKLSHFKVGDVIVDIGGFLEFGKKN